MKVIYLLFFFSSIVFLALLFQTTPVLAESNSTNTTVIYEKVNPGDGFAYPIKRLQEKAKLFVLSFSAKQKGHYLNQLVERRLAELAYVIENDKKDQFENATTRYSSTTGNWVEFVLNKQLSDAKEPAVDILTKHLPIIEKLMTKYDGTTAEWRFVKQDYDSVKLYISELQR